MKAIAGIDTTGTYEVAVRLLGRLKFPNPDVTLLNVADLVLPYTSFGVPPSLEPTNDLVEGLRQAGSEAVQEAAALAQTYGIEAKTQVESGPSVLTLLDRADSLAVDLIAIASTSKGFLAAMFTGSMSRSIVTSSRHSVLVAKEGVKNDGPVEVVLATDHSPYAEKAVERFLEMSPKGISKIHVLTAYQVNSKEADLLHANLPELEGHIEEWFRTKFEEKCQALVEKLTQHGYEAEYTLQLDEPNKAIPEEMKRTGAELLIVGAQGHGFLDRLFVGSISFHQMVAEPYSVLVLRDR